MSQAAERLLIEICEQPACLSRLLAGFPKSLDPMALPGAFTQKIIGIGEGSSYNALKIAAPYIEEFTGLNTFTFDPESLDNKFEIARATHRPIKRLFERSYFLTISQSGKTASVVNILSQLQNAIGFADAYAPMMSLTNNPNGTLSQRYGNHFDLAVGEERSIAATKSMTASIMGLLLFGVRMGTKRGWMPKAYDREILDHLKGIPHVLSRLLGDETLHRRIAQFCQNLCESNQFVLLSQGILSSVLPEVALKLTETSSNIVWADNAESFKHGRKVILQGVKGIRPNCIYIIPPNLSPNQAERLFHDIHSHFFIGDNKAFPTEGIFFTVFQNSPAIPDTLRHELRLTESEILTLPATDGIESLFVTLVSFHLVSYYLAKAKGQDPNNAALQKAVI